MIEVATSAQRKRKLGNQKIVEGQTISESQSEQLLEVVINNNMTWKDHLYRDRNNPRLIQQLSQCLGLLKKLLNVASSPLKSGLKTSSQKTL